MNLFKQMNELVVGTRNNLPLCQNIQNAPLAFLTYNENNAASKSRIDTVKNWCGSDGVNYLDNPFLLGFVIVDVVQRYNTKNKWFRVYDPRGFIVELSTDAMLELIHSGTIKEGVVQERCFWARKGSENILIPENSELHEQFLAETYLPTIPNISTKDLKIGGLYTNKDNKKYFYLGKLLLKNRQLVNYTLLETPPKEKFTFYVFGNLTIRGDDLTSDFLVTQKPTFKIEDSTQFNNDTFNRLKNNINFKDIKERVKIPHFYRDWSENQPQDKIQFTYSHSTVVYDYEWIY